MKGRCSPRCLDDHHGHGGCGHGAHDRGRGGHGHGRGGHGHGGCGRDRLCARCDRSQTTQHSSREAGEHLLSRNEECVHLF